MGVYLETHEGSAGGNPMGVKTGVVDLVWMLVTKITLVCFQGEDKWTKMVPKEKQFKRGKRVHYAMYKNSSLLFNSH